MFGTTQVKEVPELGSPKDVLKMVLGSQGILIPQKDSNWFLEGPSSTKPPTGSFAWIIKGHTASAAIQLGQAPCTIPAARFTATQRPFLKAKIAQRVPVFFTTKQKSVAVYMDHQQVLVNLDE